MRLATFVAVAPVFRWVLSEEPALHRHIPPLTDACKPRPDCSAEHLSRDKAHYDGQDNCQLHSSSYQRHLVVPGGYAQAPSGQLRLLAFSWSW